MSQTKPITTTSISSTIQANIPNAITDRTKSLIIIILASTIFVMVIVLITVKICKKKPIQVEEFQMKEINPFNDDLSIHEKHSSILE